MTTARVQTEMLNEAMGHATHALVAESLAEVAVKLVGQGHAYAAMVAAQLSTAYATLATRSTT